MHSEASYSPEGTPRGHASEATIDAPGAPSASRVRLEGQQPSQREERRRQSAEDGILVIFRLGELS
jgi:hypothetical protein